MIQGKENSIRKILVLLCTSIIISNSLNTYSRGIMQKKLVAFIKKETFIYFKFKGIEVKFLSSLICLKLLQEL